MMSTSSIAPLSSAERVVFNILLLKRNVLG